MRTTATSISLLERRTVEGFCEEEQLDFRKMKVQKGKHSIRPLTLTEGRVNGER